MTSYSPIEYLKIDIANQYGMALDKKSFSQRIAWVNRVKDLRSKTHQAEKPAQFLAAVMALEDALAGVPTGHLVGLDAPASGISILGMLVGCHTTSANTGIIGQKRMDMYMQCTKAMNSLLTEDIVVPRGEVKDAQLPHFYGSKAKPKEIFGDGTTMLEAFYLAQESVAPGACFMMRELLSSWQPYALAHRHTLPDGYRSIVPVLQQCNAKIEIDELNHATLTYLYDNNIGSEKGLAVAANCVQAIDAFLVRETSRRCNYDQEQLREVLQTLTDNARHMLPCAAPEIEAISRKYGFLSLRGIEFINSDTVLRFSMDYRNELIALIQETLAKPSFPILTIHDEYRAHANHINAMREVYRDVLVELADSRIGEQIIQEVRNDPSYTLTKFSTDLGDEILKAEYFLT